MGQLSWRRVLFYLRLTSCHSGLSGTSGDTATLRRLGGTFCEFSHGLKTGELLNNKVHSFLGWPEDGGVWLLELSRKEAYDRRVGAIRLAKTMEERCHEIQMCGGTFCADPTECERTRDLVG